MRRGKKLYLRYIDADGTERTRLARGCNTKADAEPMLREIERNIMLGKVGVPEMTEEQKARSTITIGELADRFLGDVDGDPGYAPPSIKSIANYRRDARSMFKARILPTLGKRAAAAIDLHDVERFRDFLLTDEDYELQPASVVQTLAILSKLYNWARRSKLIDCINPCQGVERPTPSSTVDYLDKPEVGRLLAKAEELARLSPSFSHEARVRAPMIAFCVFTGVRKGEALGLRWVDVHLEAARVDVMRSYELLPKSGEPRHLPLHPELVRILREWKKVCPPTAEGVVFPVEPEAGVFRMGNKNDDLGLAGVYVAAGCHEPADGHCWHMLRHVFSSHAVMSGVSLYELQRLLGHSTPVMSARYAHLAPDHLAGAVARLTFAPVVASDVPDLGEERRKRAADGTGTV